MSKFSDLLAKQIVEEGLPVPLRDFRFHEVRKWELDVAWPDSFLVVEVQGGVWSKPGAKRCPHCGQLPRGAHGTGRGIERDIDKMNAAQLTGWDVLLVTPKMVLQGKGLALVKEWFLLEGWGKVDNVWKYKGGLP